MVNSLKDTTFLFYGHAGEYSLHPFYLALKKNGYNVIEIDMYQCNNPSDILHSLHGKRIIFITSAHLLLDQYNYQQFYKQKLMFSPLEIMAYLKPVLSIYYPHDLIEPLQEEEYPYISLFDLLLTPIALPNAISTLTKTVDVGYVKYDPAFKPEKNKNPLYMLSLIERKASQYFNGDDLSQFIADYGALLDLGTVIKLPHWPGDSAIEAAFDQHGIRYYPSTMNSIEAMLKHDIIVSEALSSTAYEAALLGKHVIYLQNPLLETESPKKRYKDCDNIHYTTLNTVNTLVVDDMICEDAPQLKPFDFELALNEIAKLL